MKSNACEKRKRFIIVILFLLALLLISLVLNVNTGTVAIGFSEIMSMIAGAIKYSLLNLFSGGAYEEQLSSVLNASTQSLIIFNIRLPRLLLAAILGGALSVSGYLLQVFFRTPIAGPFVLGISSGARMLVGLTLIVFSGFAGRLTSFSLIAAAFAGSLIITFFVLILSQRVRSMSMLLVSGIMLGYICSAVTDVCINFAKEHDVVNLTSWSMGSFSGADWSSVGMAFLFCVPCTLLAFLLSKPIEAYSLGENYAKSMGINIKPFRAALILLSSLLSGCVTALAGPVSFVGIAVPHITRTLLKSSKPIYVIPASFLCGSVFCVLCDLIARTVFAPTELSIGTVTSIFGAPVVIYMMLRRRREL